VKRIHRVKVGFTAAEMASINALSGQLRISASALVRRAFLLCYKVKPLGSKKSKKSATSAG